MRHDSLYRLGGSTMVLGAVLFGVAILLHAPQPADLAAFGSLPMGAWMASHWLLAVGAIATAGGLATLSRHLAHTAGEGWAVLGLGVNIATAALFVAVVAPEIVAFDALRAMNADGNNVGAQHAYLAVNVGLMSLVHVVSPLFWVGVACYALAMLGDATWPRWVGQVGLAVAVVEIAANWVLAGSWIAFKLVSVLGFAWLAVAGLIFYRFAGRATGEVPGVAAPSGAYRSPSERARTRG